jgi:hypothetical protein
MNIQNIQKLLLQHSVKTLGALFWSFYMQWYLWSSYGWLQRFLSTRKVLWCLVCTWAPTLWRNLYSAILKTEAVHPQHCYYWL